MPHQAYHRDVEGSSVALLCIHGILGSPRHFDPFLEQVPQTWAVDALLLQGHGGKVTDFSAATMADWKAQVAQAVQRLLESHQTLLILAHSMGTLFALESALANPKVAGLFLLAPPLCPRPRLALGGIALRVLFDRYTQADQVVWGTRQMYSMDIDRNLLKYVGWLPNYLALFREIRQVRQQLHKLHTPTWCYVGGEDEMVSPATARVLSRVEGVKVALVADAWHSYYNPRVERFLHTEFQLFCQQWGAHTPTDRQGG